MNKYIKLIVLLLIITACNDNSTTDQGVNNSNGNQIMKNYGTVVLDNGKLPADFIMDKYEVISAEVVDNHLHVKLRYGGGCEEHYLNLIAYSYFAESLPVQASLLLSHDAGGDACKALIYEEFYFDLSPLINEYSEAYPQYSSPLQLKILVDKETSDEIKLLFPGQ